jgi:hypothetical protein
VLTATTSSELSMRLPKRRERVAHLAEVNGRVFVNNVSLGVYAESVQREGYRDAKLRTIAETMPTVLGPPWRRARPALYRRRWTRAQDQRGRARPASTAKL